jgi:hypothetical protein
MANPAVVNLFITISRCKCSSKVGEWIVMSSTKQTAKSPASEPSAKFNARKNAESEFLNPYGTRVY